jgi:hypothetical protein
MSHIGGAAFWILGIFREDNGPAGEVGTFFRGSRVRGEGGAPNLNIEFGDGSAGRPASPVGIW